MLNVVAETKADKRFEAECLMSSHAIANAPVVHSFIPIVLRV